MRRFIIKKEAHTERLGQYGPMCAETGLWLNWTAVMTGTGRLTSSGKTLIYSNVPKKRFPLQHRAIKSIENCGEENASEIFINIYNDNINMVAIVNN